MPDHRMTMREFQTSGCIQEVNRRLLHPRGLALIVVNHYADDDPDHKGEVMKYSFGGIMDYRGDPEGIRYSADELDDPSTLESFHAFEALGADLRETRAEALGYLVQSLPSGPAAEADQNREQGHEAEVAHWQSLWSRAVAEGRTSTARVAELETTLEQIKAGTAPAADAPVAGMDETGWDAEYPRQSFLALRSLFISQGRELRRTKSLLASAEKAEDQRPKAGYGSDLPKLEASPALEELVASHQDAFLAGVKAFAYLEGGDLMVGDQAGGTSLMDAVAKAYEGTWDNEIHLAVTAGQDRRGIS